MKLCIRQGFVFQLLKDKMLLLFLEKSYVPLHLCYIRSSFITTSLIGLESISASPALDQEAVLQQVRKVTSLGISVLLPPWTMVYN